ncbi:hypothetical protein [Polaromonas sp. CG9_12]|nr:hypothetical protein [Polaromonas sp. CG9_12]
MSPSPHSSTALAAASSDHFAIDSAREAELDSPVNVYGFREAVTQEQVNSLLERTGVPPCLALADLPPYGGVMAEIERHAKQTPDTPSLYCFKGADVPALFPAALGKYPVWYIRLPDNMERAISKLVQSGLGPCAGYTDNPWERASYIQIASQAFTANDGRTQSPDAFLCQGVEFRADRVNSYIHLAAEKGCVLVIYECAGLLTLTGYPLDEDTVLHLQASEASTYFNPARMEPWSELQARMRAVEETGEDPQAWGGVSVRILDIFSFDQNASENAPPAAPLTKTSRPYAQAPGISACLMESAGVGRLGKVMAYVPPELLQDRQIWLRNTVTPELFHSLQDNKCQYWVERLRLADEEADAFVVVVQSDVELALIALKTDDVRFRQAYDGWAGAGVCPLAIENLMNGRMFALPLAWPREFVGSLEKGLETAAELRLRLSQRALGELLHEDRAVRDMAERMAIDEGKHLHCGFSEAIDESEWAIQSQLTW